MLRVCSPDGRIAINDLSPEPEKAEALNRAEKLRDPSHVRALPTAELRALGKHSSLEEIAVSSYRVPRIPLEAVLATSFPWPGDLEKVRDLYRSDAQSGADTYGLRTEFSALAFRRPSPPNKPMASPCPLGLSSCDSPPKPKTESRLPRRCKSPLPAQPQRSS